MVNCPAVVREIRHCRLNKADKLVTRETWASAEACIMPRELVKRLVPGMSAVSDDLGSQPGGGSLASAELLPLIYEELRRLAARKLANEAPGQTLQATALVHEAWLSLSRNDGVKWQSRGQFLAAAAEAMRHILIDRARRKNRVRHGKGLTRVDLEHVDLAAASDDETLLQVDEALVKLAAEDPVKAELVKLRYFAGLSIPEAADALGISESTTKRAWAYARAWLYEELRRGQ